MKDDCGLERMKCCAEHQRLCMGCPAGKTPAVRLRNGRPESMRCVFADVRLRNAVRWMDETFRRPFAAGDENGKESESMMKMAKLISEKDMSDPRWNRSMRMPLDCDSSSGGSQFFLLTKDGWKENAMVLNGASMPSWTDYTEEVPAALAVRLNRLTVELGCAPSCPFALEHEILSQRIKSR